MHVSYNHGSCCAATVAAAGHATAAAGSTVLHDDPQQLTFTILRPMKPDKATHKLQMLKLDEQISLDRAKMKNIKALLHSKPIAGHVAAGRVGASATEQVLYSIASLKAERECLRQEIHDLCKQRHDIRTAYKKAWHVYGREEQAWRAQQRQDRRWRTGTTCAQDPDHISPAPGSLTSSGSGRRSDRCRAPPTTLPTVRHERTAVRLGCHRSRGRGHSSSSGAQPAEVTAALAPVSLPGGAGGIAAAPEVGRNSGDGSPSNSGVLDRLDLSGVLESAESPTPFRHYPAIPGFVHSTAAQPVAGDAMSDSSSDSGSTSSSDTDSDAPLVSRRASADGLGPQQQQVHVAAGAQRSGQGNTAVVNPFVSLPPLTPATAAEPVTAMAPVHPADRDIVNHFVTTPVPAPVPATATAAALSAQPPPAAAAAAAGIAQGSFTVAITGGGVDGERSTCIVCLDAPRSVLLLPCKHLVLCEGCARDLQQTAMRGADNSGRRSRRIRRGGGGRRRSRPVAGAEVPGTVVRVLWRVWFGRGRDNDNHSDTDSVFSGVSATASSSRDRVEAAAGEGATGSGCLSCPVCRVPVEQQMLVYT